MSFKVALQGEDADFWWSTQHSAFTTRHSALDRRRLATILLDCRNRTDDETVFHPRTNAMRTWFVFPPASRGHLLRVNECVHF
jgi:hypothetical protein